MPRQVVHTARLVETHRIMLPIGATADNLAVAKLHAEAYARARGFEIIGLSGVSTFDPPASGVQFTLTVGTGDISLDQRVPGVLDLWRWSAGAVEWWQSRLGTGEGKVIALVDESGRKRLGRITGMREVPGDPGHLSVEGEFTDGSGGFHGLGDPRRMPGQWGGPEALRGAGISRCPTMPGGQLLPHTHADGQGCDQAPPWMRRADGDDSEGE